MDEQVNILLVDDNVSQIKTMAFVLERKGYAVTIAKDGPEAIHRSRDNPYDLILIDIKMPVMNGVEAYRQIKQIRPETVVVMMTAYAVEDLIQEALELGAYGVLYKPLDLEKVVALIEEVSAVQEDARVLVVDDDPVLCEILEKTLIVSGHDVDVAHTGEEALALARSQPYDIVLLDMKLPTMNGLETYLSLKEILPGIMAIMMTGYWKEMADPVYEALSKQAYVCLQKPFRMEKILQLIIDIRRERRKIG